MKKAPASLRPVFLVGCPRSGTTLLQRLLDAHPLIAIAPETHFILQFWQPRRQYGDLADDGSFERLIADIVAMPEFADMRIGAFVRAAVHDSGWRERRRYSCKVHATRPDARAPQLVNFANFGKIVS